MESDPRIWHKPEIGCLCPPSTHPPLPCPLFLVLVLFSFSSGTSRTYSTGHSWSHTRVAAKRDPFSPTDVSFQWFNLGNRGREEAWTQSAQCGAPKFTLELYEKEQRSLTSRKVPLQNGPSPIPNFTTIVSCRWKGVLMEHHQKRQVMQRQICLQMHLLTPSWQDLLFTILCKGIWAEQCNQSPPSWTHSWT